MKNAIYLDFISVKRQSFYYEKHFIDSYTYLVWNVLCVCL